MRFIHVTQGYHPDLAGGGYRYAREVACLLAARRHECHVITKNPGNRLPETERVDGVEVHRVPSVAGGFWRNWPVINASARRTLSGLVEKAPGPTLVVAHHAYFEPAFRGTRRVVFFQGPWAHEHRIACRARARSLARRVLDEMVAKMLHRYEARSLREASHILVASDYVRGQIPVWHPSVRTPVQVVGGGANLEQFQPSADRAQIRLSAGLLPGERMFLAVRRLDPRMGLRELVDAFGYLAPRHPEVRLWIAGKGAMQAELEEKIEKLAVRRQVRLIGFVPESDLARLYSMSDMVIMPSLDLEGFGLVTAESMACGTPVLASRSGANAELVTPLDPGLLFEAGSVDSLVRKLEEVMGGRLKLPSRERVVELARRLFRWERPVEALEALHPQYAVNPGGTG